MVSTTGAILARFLAITTIFIAVRLISNLLLVRRIPGPKSYAITKWRLAYDDWKGLRTRSIHQLHQRYGPVVRIGPNEISFNSVTALKTIYGAGSGFERTPFYRMFDAYGYQNLFTFAGVKEHGERKKLLNHAYSKSSILRSSAGVIEEKVWEYLQLIEKDHETASETFSSLHYYSLDNITHFLYGSEYGGTSSLTGSKIDRTMLSDVLDPSRRKLAWFAVHLPRYTKWLMTRTGLCEKVVAQLGMLPQKKPTVYTGIRNHALASSMKFSTTSSAEKSTRKTSTIIGRLADHHISVKEGGLQDLEIASEAADHFLAGVDTTSDSLMFLIWALSLPENTKFQQKLTEEVSAMSDETLDARGIPTANATDKLPYLDAVIKETLRLYAPLPASEPRCLPVDCMIDGYHVPAKTVVSMSPYNLHRNHKVFKDPLVFNPDRWLRDAKEVAEMKKWFWAFSSGGRMCIGIHLAMAEMTTLTAAIYRKYRTTVKAGTEHTSPGITSRFEVFCDETKLLMKEHECYINFEKRSR
ncbi:putative benzoate 4-monooxygenase cytochrome P450 [Rhexocercosporidium sp. MPI-PUGE-AT-0058]|nr:putative benzoate 4-monooxygenase cytochrome P450 [Rhexocercosporidium sp. MPI-PUGE-AT-0058]